jgi:SOS-response transcriptional repressor LexA
MISIREIRRNNLQRLVERHDTMKNLNEVLDRKDNLLTQILNQSMNTATGKPKAMGDRLARDIEKKLNLGFGWMDQDHSEEPPEPKNIVTLDRLDVEAGCDPSGGPVCNDVAVVERLQVSVDWFKQNISRYRTIGHQLVTARGDSMEPTINSGDIVVVDVRDTDVTQEGIFCVNYGGGVTIKRIQVLPFGVEFISDNKLYNSFVLKGQEIDAIKIIGRVVTALCVKKFHHGI